MMFLKLTRWARNSNGDPMRYHGDPVYVNILMASGIWQQGEGDFRVTNIPTVGEAQDACYSVQETPELILAMIEEKMG